MTNTKTNSCKDCGLPCDKRCLRCQACSNKINGKSRPRHPKQCEGCGKKLAKRKYKRCHSCSMKSRWSDEEYGKKTREAIRKSFDIRWSDPDTRKKIVKYLVNTCGTSKLEKSVAQIAVQFGFENGVVVGRYLADLLNEKTKTIIEVNGDLWHCNPKFWKSGDTHPTIKVNAQSIWDRDAKRKSYLESLGYSVFVLWEDDIIKGKDVFIRKFFESLENENKSCNNS